MTSEISDLLKPIYNNTWDLLPTPVKYLQNQFPNKLHVPSYLLSLRAVKDEVDCPLTKVNTKGAENARILITDQLSTICMILRNASFSEANARILASNPFLRRFFADMLWAVFLDHEKFVFERKRLNFRKDIAITLSNIAHLMPFHSSVDGFLLLILILSFGEPKKNSGSLRSDELSYNEYSLTWGKYQSFGVDVLSKLLSTEQSTKNIIMRLLFSFSSATRDDSLSKDELLTKKLVDAYCKGDQYKLLNDVVSFLLSVIPFEQINETSSLLYSMTPLISQSITSLLLIVDQVCDEKSVNEYTLKKNMPLIWLTTAENYGYKLRSLGKLYNDISGDTNELSKANGNSVMENMEFKKLAPLIGSSCLKLVNLMIDKALEIDEKVKTNDKDEIASKTLAAVPELFPGEIESIEIITNQYLHPDILQQTQCLIELKDEILSRA